MCVETSEATRSTTRLNTSTFSTRKTQTDKSWPQWKLLFVFRSVPAFGAHPPRHHQSLLIWAFLALLFGTPLRLGLGLGLPLVLLSRLSSSRAFSTVCLSVGLSVCLSEVSLEIGLGSASASVLLLWVGPLVPSQPGPAVSPTPSNSTRPSSRPETDQLNFLSPTATASSQQRPSCTEEGRRDQGVLVSAEQTPLALDFLISTR